MLCGRIVCQTRRIDPLYPKRMLVAPPDKRLPTIDFCGKFIEFSCSEERSFVKRTERA